MTHPVTITLQHPLTRKNGDAIATVALTEAAAQAGSLRGLKLYDLMTTDVDSLIKFLPRVTEPALTEAQVMQLHTADLVALATAVANFLNPVSGASD
ncbi:MAG: phage tail assembly protein [Aeromonas sp.]